MIMNTCRQTKTLLYILKGIQWAHFVKPGNKIKNLVAFLHIAICCMYF